MKLKDLKLLSKDTIIYGIGNASNQLTKVLLAPLYAVYLAAELYGTRSITVAFYGFLRVIIMLALNQAVIADYYKAETEEERRKVVSTAFTYTLIASLIFGGALYFFAPMLSAYPLVQKILGLGFEELVPLLRLLGIFISFTPPTYIYLSLLRSQQKPGLYSVFTIATALVRVGLTVIFLVVLERNLQGLYEVDALLALPVLVIMAVLVYTYSRGIKFSFRHLRSMLAYALPLIPTTIFFWGRGMLDRMVFIPLYLTHTDVGIYAFAMNFYNVVSFLVVVPLSLAWVPYAFSIKDRPDFPKVVSRLLTYFLFIAGWGLVVLGGAAQEILRIIAKRADYWEGAILVAPLVLGVFLYAIYLILGTVCQVKRKTVYFIIVAFVGAVVTVAGNMLLLPSIGLLGAALASAASFGVMALAMFFFSRRYIKIPFEAKRLLLITVASIGVTAVFYFWSDFSLLKVPLQGIGAGQLLGFWRNLHPLIGFFIKLVLGSLAYIGLLLISGFLLPSERYTLKRFCLKLKERGSRRSR
jgi:O-antigen/teichoic acid export membrane protein